MSQADRQLTQETHLCSFSGPCWQAVRCIDKSRNSQLNPFNTVSLAQVHYWLISSCFTKSKRYRLRSSLHYILNFSVNSQKKRSSLHFTQAGRQQSGEERTLSGGSGEVQWMPHLETWWVCSLHKQVTVLYLQQHIMNESSHLICWNELHSSSSSPEFSSLSHFHPEASCWKFLIKHRY